MSAAPSYGASVEERFAEEYARAFDDFVRHVRGQGFPVSERVMEAADEKASRRAIDLATSRGHRSVNFAPMSRSGLAKARAKYGY
jgi:hypothetical protein